MLFLIGVVQKLSIYTRKHWLYSRYRFSPNTEKTLLKFCFFKMTYGQYQSWSMICTLTLNRVIQLLSYHIQRVCVDCTFQIFHFTILTVMARYKNVKECTNSKRSEKHPYYFRFSYLWRMTANFFSTCCRWNE